MSSDIETDGRIPPQDVEAEKSVLGSLLLDPTNSLPVVRELLQPSAFYSRANEKVFAAILELHDSGQTVDVITTREALRKRSDLEEIGGSAYLNELVNSVVSTANVEAHSQIVAEKYLLRTIIERNSRSIQQCYGGQSDPFQIADEQRDLLEQLLRFRRQSKSVTDAEQSLEIYLDHVDRMNRGEIGTLKTGFNELDKLLGGGFQLADAVVLAGNTGTGKSSLALQMLLNISRQVPVADFSLEMSKVRMVTRTLAQLAHLPIHQIRNPHAFFDTPTDAHRYASALQEFRQRQGRIFFDCTPDLTITELCLRIEKLSRDRGARFVVVDHLSKIAPNPGERFQNREREIAHYSWKLTQLAIRLEIVILTVSALNKEAENFTQPHLGQMRDSGMISYDARTILLLSNPMPDSTFGQAEERKATLQIAKQGDGESGISIELPFHGNRGAYFGNGPMLSDAEMEQSKPTDEAETAGCSVGHAEAEELGKAPF